MIFHDETFVSQNSPQNATYTERVTEHVSIENVFNTISMSANHDQTTPAETVISNVYFPLGFAAKLFRDLSPSEIVPEPARHTAAI